VKVHLSRQGMADQDYFDSVNAEADELAARFRAHCLAMQKPPPGRIFANVYSEPHHQLQAQEQELLGYLAGFDDVGSTGGQA
jgi:pyruvate dehydrogenase E1 component alpha subunit